MGFIIAIIANGLGLFLANYFIAGVTISGGVKELALAALLLTVLNYTVKPLLKLITFPLIIITLGLFLFVINAIILWIVAWLLPFAAISSITALLWTTLIVTILGMLASHRKASDKT